jgi:hypothetical protein
MTQMATCSFSVASGLHGNSTGKERDTETGLDYFGAGESQSNTTPPKWRGPAGRVLVSYSAVA